MRHFLQKTCLKLCQLFLAQEQNMELFGIFVYQFSRTLWKIHHFVRWLSQCGFSMSFQLVDGSNMFKYFAGLTSLFPIISHYNIPNYFSIRYKYYLKPNETVDEIMFFVFFYWFKKPQLDSHYIPGISPLWYFIFSVYLHQQDLISFPGRLSPALADILRRPWAKFLGNLPRWFHVIPMYKMV